MGLQSGACPTQGISFGITGWNLLVNAAAPWEERVPIAGLDHRDWHTFVLKIPNAQGPAQVYCDGQHVLDLQQPITTAQRKKNAANQNNRHGSIQQLVPETPGQKDYVFIESRHPGQIIDIDRFKISQEPMVTRRRSLPVLLDLDWELNGTQKIEYTLTRFEDKPVLNEADVPDPSPKLSMQEMMFRSKCPCIHWTARPGFPTDWLTCVTGRPSPPADYGPTL